jgi:type IV pilus assembly protein PilC
MPIYKYSALSESGAPVQGSEAAVSIDALRQALTRRGYLVQSIRHERRGFRTRRVKPEELLLFIQEFCALLRAGMTVTGTLDLARHRPDSPALGAIIGQVLSDVQGGASFHDACAKYPDVFDRLYLSALQTSEKTGDLAGALARYLSYLRMRVGLRKKVSQALAYPAFLGVTMLVVLVALFVFVLPRFVTIYADFGAALPWPTQLLVSVVERIWIVLPALVAAGAAGWFGWRRGLKTEGFRLAVDRFRQRLPLVGGIFGPLSAAKWGRRD